MDTPTVRVYERRAADWEARRPARHVERARAFAACVRGGALRLDAGCGPGPHLGLLGDPVVALDAAGEMARRARTLHPDALAVQADLEALPFRRGSLAGAWARASYVHVPRTRLPMALHDLHRALEVGAPVEIVVRAGDAELEAVDGDDFPGRRFAGWSAPHLAGVVHGAGFEVHAVDADGEWLAVRASRARSLADTVGPGMRLLVVGLNPSVYAADAGVGFARPGNRFWPAARLAGLVTVDRDAVAALRGHGVGMTDLVKRATPRADALRDAEHRDGLARVERLVAWLAPRAVCMVGLAGWRAAVDRAAAPGVQPVRFGGRPVYVMPSTSGANAHARLDALAAHLTRAAALAP